MTKDRFPSVSGIAPPPNFENRTLFHGDNLPFLRAMNSGSVHLIATDPPFNKGKDFHATPDSLASGASFQDRWSWDDDVHPDWIDQIEDDWPHVMHVIEGSRMSYGDDMGAFLCFMGVRLLEMHRILRNDGSIYLHCDTTASHYLKELMDAIFGKRNFHNQIVWERIKGAGKRSQHKSKSFGRSSDMLLFYTKSKDYTFDIERVAEPYPDLEKSFPYADAKGRFKRRSPFRPPGLGPRPNLCYDYKGISPPHNSGWTVKKSRLRELEEEGELEWAGNRVWRKQRPSTGINPNDVWTGIPQASGNEDEGYPTQKPLALYERIIKASSNEGDLVLDPFCGCATTLVAAEHLKRKWVGIDIWNKTYNMVIKRFQKEGLASPDGNTGDLLITFGQVHYKTELPIRTDDGRTASPILKTKVKTPTLEEPPGPRMTRSEMYEHLLKKAGCTCQGCYRKFDDPRYLQLDHNTPRSDGGLNHISNRILLCGPCNRLKSNKFTLSGLRRENKKLGYMQKDPSLFD